MGRPPRDTDFRHTGNRHTDNRPTDNRHADNRPTDNRSAGTRSADNRHTQHRPAVAPRQRPPIDPLVDPTAPANHRRPVRSFRVVGVFVIVLGAISGIYLGVGASKHSVDESLLVFDPARVASPSVDPALAQAAELARKKAAAAAAEAAEKAAKAAEVAKRDAEAASRSQTRTSYPAPSSCKEFTGNRALGCALLLEGGYGLEQMPCLDKLWTKESHWTTTAENKSSGAYGIPQALPGSKMASVADDWKTNPVTQIKWGLGYIKGRYGNPCTAWGHSQDTGWY